MPSSIVIRGCRANNLKNISLDIPHNSLVVFTGLSGSGKSSLAFDTIYAEGQRRFMESISHFSRQFLEQVEKPDVDRIEGLPPTVAIDQRSASSSPRSTVGTATEIYDLLRLLFARAGTQHCPFCGKTVSALSRQQLINAVTRFLSSAESETFLCAPLQKAQKVDTARIIAELEKLSIRMSRVDGRLFTLPELITSHIDMRAAQKVDVVVDCFARPSSDIINSGRIVDSIHRGLEFGDGTFFLWDKKSHKETMFTRRLFCTDCRKGVETIEPRHFSFNNPAGACATCAGLGALLQFVPELVIPNQKLTVAQGAVQPLAKLYASAHGLIESINDLLHDTGATLNTPIRDLTKKQYEFLLYGKQKNQFPGVIPYLSAKYAESDSEYVRSELEECMRSSLCETCAGKRLTANALAVTIADHTIDQVVALPIARLESFFSVFTVQKTSPLSGPAFHIAQPLANDILLRVRALSEVGLSYLTLDRGMQTLSGGEAQRVKLSAHVSTSLVGVVYILDEPSIGLHPRDTDKLIATLKKLQGLGNTVIVVEHDTRIIRAADTVYDIGPGAGKDGGEIIASGQCNDIEKHKASLTGAYLSGKRTVSLPKKRKERPREWIEIVGAAEHNLKHITMRIPLGKLVVVTGVSGSGKSTLVIDILSRVLMKKFYRAKAPPGAHETIRGLECIDKAIVVDQTPIGRTPRSNPVTYTNIFTAIRELYTNLPESKIKGFTPGHFSFNVKGGRCETCQGEGITRIDMRFLSDVYVECGDCGGKRYTPSALEVHYEGLSIADVLDLTVSEACEVFKKIPAITDKLRVLLNVGLGYIRLGQPAPTLSGGEAQRIKLATELSRRATGRTLTILDEPTTGLHFEDIQRLLGVLDALVAKGNTVLMIEHNLDVIRNADWIIDLGPEGGEDGGYLVAEGTPEETARNPKSITGQYLNTLMLITDYGVRSQKN